MLTIRRLLLPVCLAAVSCAPAYAQSEPEFRDFFEGKSVRVKIDMPATQEGIDVFPDARRAVDFAAYSARLKSTGIAIHNGESVMVTKVRVKDKLIEFQLAGGGYGTFGDDTGSVSATTVSKSKRERDLEKLVKDEPDADRRRRLQRELDDSEERPRAGGRPQQGHGGHRRGSQEGADRDQSPAQWIAVQHPLQRGSAARARARRRDARARRVRGVSVRLRQPPRRSCHRAADASGTAGVRRCRPQGDDHGRGRAGAREARARPPTAPKARSRW